MPITPRPLLAAIAPPRKLTEVGPAGSRRSEPWQTPEPRHSACASSTHLTEQQPSPFQPPERAAPHCATNQPTLAISVRHDPSRRLHRSPPKPTLPQDLICTRLTQGLTTARYRPMLQMRRKMRSDKTSPTERPTNRIFAGPSKRSRGIAAIQNPPSEDSCDVDSLVGALRSGGETAAVRRPGGRSPTAMIAGSRAPVCRGEQLRLHRRRQPA